MLADSPWGRLLSQSCFFMRRILTLDGGGIKGVFPAAFLATIEDSIDRPLARYFDLIVGTSTGGILALGLGLGLSATEILRFYEESGERIFRGNSFFRKILRLGVSKYGSKPLRAALESVFGERRLGESQVRLVVPSFNLETGEVHIYKTAHHSRFERDYKEKAVDVALATSSAPTYFPTHRSAAGSPLVDGGVFANNPAGLAVVEALGVLKWPADAICLLSLSCTKTPLAVGWGRNLPLGVGYWVLKLTSVFMSAQSSLSWGTAQLLLGDEPPHRRAVRIEPIMPAKRFGMDKASEIRALVGLGHSEARKALPSLRQLFFQEPAEQFVPYHS